MASLSLISRLRSRIRDERPSVKAMTLGVDKASVTRATAEITEDHLMVTVQGGDVSGIDIDLSESRFATIADLHYHLSRLDGYVATLDQDAVLSHPSVDVMPMSARDIGPASSHLDLVHHVFSDEELDVILTEAVQRHNPSFTASTLPEGEEVFVMHLAQAEVCRRQAYDSSKRKGLSETVADLLQIAESLERTYADDVRRLARAITSPKEATSDSMRQGDVVLGTMFRSSLRTGRKAASGQNLPPPTPLLHDPDDARDVADDNIRLRWTRSSENDLYAYELWLDTTQDVQRAGPPDSRGTPFAGPPLTTSEDPYPGVIRDTTSKLVFRSFGHSAGFESISFFSYIEEFGQSAVSFIVGELESETEYFFRLYVFDRNREHAASEVIRCRTKALRASFAEVSPVTPLLGAPGTVVTLNFDPTKGAFTANHRIKVGGKEVAYTLVSASQATFEMPAFENIRVKKDISVTSPTGLVDLIKEVFQVS